MKQKFLPIIALLLMAATGAWAQTEELLTTIKATDQTNYSETTPGVVTVTHDNDYFTNNFGWIWWHAGSLTVEAKEGYTITKCVFSQPYKTSVTVSSAPFKVKFVETHPSGDDFTAYLIEGTNPDENMDGVSSIEVYGYAPAAATGYSVTLKDDTEDATNWKAKVGNDELQALPLTGLTGDGTETVTVTYNGEKKVKSVTAVKKAATIPVTAITLNKTATSIEVGSTETLSVTAVAPDNATDKTYTWKTSDASKATVDQDGKVTAVAAGTVTIYAEANDGSGVKGNCTVTVTPTTITVTINQSDWGWDSLNNGSFTKGGVTVSAGDIDPINGNLMNNVTFSTTLGKFTKIVVTAKDINFFGTDWSGNSSSMTWAGTPASTVSFSGHINGHGQTQTTIVCTIVPTN